MAIVDRKELPLIRQRHRNQRIVFCSGCFDLTHVGHLNFFECCKALGDILVVMVGCDSVLRDYKGKNSPILGEKARLKMVNGLKPVDYVFLENSMRVSESDPVPTPQEMLATLEPILDELDPDFYAVNDDAFDIAFRTAMLMRHRTAFIVMDRMCGSIPQEWRFNEISTTYLVEKIKRMGH